MTDYNSKYSGEQVEALLDQVASGNAGGGGSGGITEETDPIFLASPAASITDANIEQWNNDSEMIVSLDEDVAKLYDRTEDVVKNVAINGSNIAKSGETIYFPNAGTDGRYGVVSLENSVSSTATDKAATAYAVKQAYDTAKNAVSAHKVGELTAIDIQAINDNIFVYGFPTTANGDEDDILLSQKTVKTINGESIYGSGDITISGGSGGGEDIRYFTKFTVEDFIEACESGNIITYNTTELFNAMKSNKVICVPYRGYDKGFIVASYKTGRSTDYPYMYLQKGDVEYFAWTGDSHELVGEYPIYNSVQVVEMGGGGEVVIEVLDNHIYRITDSVDFLGLAFSNIQKGATIQFMSGTSGTTLESAYNVLWANGEIPQIEPNTLFELSIIQNAFYSYNAVLTPFKPV